MMPPLTLQERAQGAYLGFALGDALGATVEFMTAREIRVRYGTHRSIQGGGWLKLTPGAVTDDTQMSLALGNALLQAGGWDATTAAAHWAAWMRSGPPDIGHTCRRGLRRYLTQGTLHTPYDESTGGNGGAMRCLPVVLYTLGRPAMRDELVLAQAHITHHQCHADAATVAIGRMAHALLCGDGIGAARAVADDLAHSQPCFRFEPYPGRASAYIVDTLQTVCDGFFHTDSFEGCLVRVVNRGDDADTTGAIAGMLAGALYGARALPVRWLRRLDKEVHAAVLQQTGQLLRLNQHLRAALGDG